MTHNTGKAAIFDLDGTLLDSMGVWDRVDVEVLNRRGFEVPADYMGAVSAMQFDQIANYTIARFGLSDTPQQLMNEWNEIASYAYATEVQLKPYAFDYLTQLKNSGAKLAVATSLPPNLREPAMQHVGIDGLFDVVCSVDDAGNIGKEHPDIYMLTAQRLGVDSQHCTVFEDILVGLRSAKSVGMSVWAMHDDSSDRDWETICEVADGVLFDFSNAPACL